MAKTTPRNGHIILPVNTDLFESVEENAKEHGVNTDLFECRGECKRAWSNHRAVFRLVIAKTHHTKWIL